MAKVNASKYISLHKKAGRKTFSVKRASLRSSTTKGRRGTSISKKTSVVRKSKKV